MPAEGTVKIPNDQYGEVTSHWDATLAVGSRPAALRSLLMDPASGTTSHVLITPYERCAFGFFDTWPKTFHKCKIRKITTTLGFVVSIFQEVPNAVVV